MNRQIKFRAWDKELKVMRYRWLNIIPDSEHAWAWGKHDDDLQGANAHVQRYFTDTLMQYTGLKDKNGKEIWEGDILAIPNRGDWEVKYVVDGFHISQGEHNYGMMTYNSEIEADMKLQNYEVIGNIYENSDLLQ